MAANNKLPGQRLVYLITYSQADLQKYPTRESFVRIIEESFLAKNLSLKQWVVSIEKHEDGGKHYHMALKLSKRSRWAAVRRHIVATYGINVNFNEGEEGDTYYMAYLYVKKEDPNFVQSEGHPDMTVMPRTTEAVKSKRRKARGLGKKRVKIMSDFELLEMIQERKMTTRLEVMALAASLQSEGNCSLAECIANKGSKCVDNALALSVELAEAKNKLERAKVTRIEVLEATRSNPCIEGCNGAWLQSAEQVLQQNRIDVSVFATAMYDVLKNGRGKFRNIYIHGPANCGKSFLLKPLKEIYTTFSNPAHGTFAWVGVDDKEIIFLNDFRWSPVIIAWETFLILLEGDVTHLPAPKNACSKDIELTRDTPIFATADMPIMLAKGGAIDAINTRMMDVRWKQFNLWRVIQQCEQKELLPCPRCFADIIFKHKK